MGNPTILSIDPSTLAELHKLLAKHNIAARMDFDVAAGGVGTEPTPAPTISPKSI
jgi:hypothetical protein